MLKTRAIMVNERTGKISHGDNVHSISKLNKLIPTFISTVIIDLGRTVSTENPNENINKQLINNSDRNLPSCKFRLQMFRSKEIVPELNIEILALLRLSIQ